MFYYLKAALLAFVLAMLGGLLVGGGVACYLLSTQHAEDPSQKARIYASAVAESLNTAAFFMVLFGLIGVPAALFMARRKRRAAAK